uniref:Uncharacterized protein n=1 Tax=Chenopodium quinoa TaxID=63459 RepID=A0A803N508_CHEQI
MGKGGGFRCGGFQIVAWGVASWRGKAGGGVGVVAGRQAARVGVASGRQGWVGGFEEGTEQFRLNVALQRSQFGVSFVKLDYMGLMKLGNVILRILSALVLWCNRILLFSFSEGIHIKNLILNDLYYHLLGELEGRDIEHGAFKELSRFLSSSNLLQTYQKKCVNDYSAGANNAYLFDLWRLQRDIGLYFWDCSEWKALKKIAENTLFYVQRANSMLLILSSSSQRASFCNNFNSRYGGCKFLAFLTLLMLSLSEFWGGLCAIAQCGSLRYKLLEVALLVYLRNVLGSSRVCHSTVIPAAPPYPVLLLAA